MGGLHHDIYLALIILLGMIAGSFINMATYRLAVEDKSAKDLLLKPSFCPKCNHQLGILNLIPIFSYLFQSGKCSFCREKIPARYLIIEIISTISFVIIYFYLGQNFDLKLALILLAFMALLTMIITDLEHYFISNLNQIILFLITLAYHIFIDSDNQNSLIYYFLSAAFYLIFGLLLSSIFKYFFDKDGIGIDDIKFFSVAGFILGIHQFAIFMFLSGIIGIIFGLLWQKIKKDTMFPFAPALIFALIVCLIVDFDLTKIISLI